jgi:hypothetical protein
MHFEARFSLSFVLYDMEMEILVYLQANKIDFQSPRVGIRSLLLGRIMRIGLRAFRTRRWSSILNERRRILR